MNWIIYLPLGRWMKKPGGLKVCSIFHYDPPDGQMEMEWTRLMIDYEHTSLKPYVEMFEKHVAAVLRDSRMVKKGERLFNLLPEIVLTFSIEGGEYGFLGVLSSCCMHLCCIHSGSTDDPRL
jgi:hypothetical protein